MSLGRSIALKMGSRGPSFIGPMDDFTSGLMFACEVRQRLLTSYENSLIRVRRSSDDTETDIGYTANGSLDEEALVAFCGAGDGFVKTVYDQSGNSRDLSQTINSQQPLIVSSGVVETANGHPALVFESARSTFLTQTNALFVRTWISPAQLLTSIDYAGLVTGGGNYILLGNSPSSAMFGSSASNYAYRVDSVDKTSPLVPFGFDWHTFTLTADATNDVWKWGTERTIPSRYFDGPSSAFVAYSTIPGFLSSVETLLN